MDAEIPRHGRPWAVRRHAMEAMRRRGGAPARAGARPAAGRVVQ